MRDDCIIAVEQAIGRSLSKAEQKTIEDTVSKQMRLLARKDPEAWMALTPQERLDQGAKAAADDMIFQLQRQQQLIRLTIAAHDRIETQLNDALERLPEKKFKAGARGRIVSQLLDFDVRADGMPMSVHSWHQSIKNEALGELMPMWTAVKGGFLHFFGDDVLESHIYKEMYNEDSGNPAAKAGVDAWKNVTGNLLDRWNKSGGNTGDLGDDYHKPQSWSQGKVANAGIDFFENKMLDLIDKKKYLNEDGSLTIEDDLRHSARYWYDSIIRKNFVDPSDDGFYSSKTADRMARHRVIFFKDAASAQEADKLFGQKNLWDTMKSHVDRMARNIALNEILGPDSKATFNYFNDRAALDDIRQFEKKERPIKWRQNFNKDLYDKVSGNEVVEDQAIADAGQAYRNWKTWALLPKVMLSAIGDEVAMAATCFANRVPYGDVAIRQLKYMNPANAEDRYAAAHSGLGLNTILGNINKFAAEDFGGNGAGFWGKLAAVNSVIASKVMKYSGAEPMWDVRRRALGSVLQSYIGRMASIHENFSDLNWNDAGVLTRKGVTENDWQVWKRAQTKDWGYGAHTVLTPKNVYEIPDEAIAHLGDPAQLKRHAATMLLGHVLEETGMGVTDTGPRQRVGMALGTKKGTYGGELISASVLFKGYSVSIMMKHWQRAAELPGTGNKVKYGAMLTVGGMAIAGLVSQLRNLAAGKDPDNMTDPKFWGGAALRGGGLGYYGDFIYSQMNERDENVVIAALGPIAQDMNRANELTLGYLVKHAKGERTDEASKFIRLGKENIPFLRMWYTQAAADHILFNEMQEAVNPGYLDRMQQRAQAERGTTNWWDAHDMLPARAPDFSKAIDVEAGQESMQRSLDKIQRSFER